MTRLRLPGGADRRSSTRWASTWGPRWPRCCTSPSASAWRRPRRWRKVIDDGRLGRKNKRGFYTLRRRRRSAWTRRSTRSCPEAGPATDVDGARDPGPAGLRVPERSGAVPAGGDPALAARRRRGRDLRPRLPAVPGRALPLPRPPGRALRGGDAGAARSASTASASAPPPSSRTWPARAGACTGADRRRRSGNRRDAEHGKILRAPAATPRGPRGHPALRPLLGKRRTLGEPCRSSPKPTPPTWACAERARHPRARGQHLHAVGGGPRCAGERHPAAGDPRRAGREGGAHPHGQSGPSAEPQPGGAPAGSGSTTRTRSACPAGSRAWWTPRPPWGCRTPGASSR